MLRRRAATGILPMHAPIPWPPRRRHRRGRLVIGLAGLATAIGLAALLGALPL